MKKWLSKRILFFKDRLLNPSKSIPVCIFIHMNILKNKALDFMYYFAGLNCFENIST